MALDGLDIDLVEPLDEELAVLGVHDRLDGGAEHLQIVFFQDSLPVQGHSAVERGLTSECEENALGLLLLDDRLHEEGSHGEEIYLVGYTFRCLDGSDIGIDQDSLYAFLAHGLEGLGAGIVELAGLADFEGSRTQEQDFLYSGVDHGLQHFNEFVKEEFGVGRTAGGLGVELYREETAALVPQALVGAVVHVDE